MPNVVNFPGATTVAPPPIHRALAAPPLPQAASRLPTTLGRGGEYALNEVARALGLTHFGIRTIVTKLRALAQHDGMPLPRTPRIVNTVPLRGPLVIYSKSRWDGAAFDAWLDGRGPHGPAAAQPARTIAPAIRDEMMRRAGAL